MFGVRDACPRWGRTGSGTPGACEVLQEGEGALGKWDGGGENGKEVGRQLGPIMKFGLVKKKKRQCFS